MFRFALRMLWRGIILAAGGYILWWVIFKAVPYADARLPIFYVVVLTYCFLVYMVIPLLIRIFRLFIKANHVPHYTTTYDGWPSDPINIAIIASSRDHLKQIMEQAGWYMAEPLNLKNGIREVLSIIFNTPYPAAPFSRLFLFNRSHDIGFQIPSNSAGSARTRHHVRFWRVEEPKTTKSNSHYEFWMSKLRSLLKIEKEVWIGAAIEDTQPINFSWRDGGRIIHGVSQDADRERDFLVQSLVDIKQVKSVSITQPGKQIKFHGQQYFKASFTVDGSIEVVTLK